MSAQRTGPPRTSGSKTHWIWAAPCRAVEAAASAFTEPRITPVTMPPLANGNQSIPGIAVTFAVDDVTDEAPSGNPATGPAYKQWLNHNFKLNVPGLGGRVASIDSLTWRVIDVDDGSWQAWYDEYALKGDQSDTLRPLHLGRPVSRH